MQYYGLSIRSIRSVHSYKIARFYDLHVVGERNGEWHTEYFAATNILQFRPSGCSFRQNLLPSFTSYSRSCFPKQISCRKYAHRTFKQSNITREQSLESGDWCNIQPFADLLYREPGRGGLKSHLGFQFRLEDRILLRWGWEERPWLVLEERGGVGYMGITCWSVRGRKKGKQPVRSLGQKQLIERFEVKYSWSNICRSNCCETPGYW